jgi:hypothetical protein
VLQFPSRDVLKVVEECKAEGLLLRSTWPTHQRLWDGQDTKNVRRIEGEILIWNVNHMLTEDEVGSFGRIVKKVHDSV